MSRMKQEDVEKIATEYAKGLELAPFRIEGSEFDDNDTPPSWRVYLSFCEPPTDEIGWPDGLVIDVNDLTAEASHINSL